MVTVLRAREVACDRGAVAKELACNFRGPGAAGGSRSLAAQGARPRWRLSREVGELRRRRKGRSREPSAEPRKDGASRSRSVVFGWPPASSRAQAPAWQARVPFADEVTHDARPHARAA